MAPKAKALDSNQNCSMAIPKASALAMEAPKAKALDSNQILILIESMVN